MNPYERLEELRKRLRRQFPEVGLTFGYVGNIYQGDRSDLRWMYFTQVPDKDKPKQFGGYYCFSWPSCGVPDGKLGELAMRAEAELETWLRDTVSPHTADAWRSYEVNGAGVDGYVWSWLRSQGASYGLMSHNRILFSIQRVALEQLRERFPDYRWETRWPTKED